MKCSSSSNITNRVHSLQRETKAPCTSRPSMAVTLATTMEATSCRVPSRGSTALWFPSSRRSPTTANRIVSLVGEMGWCSRLALLSHSHLFYSVLPIPEVITPNISLLSNFFKGDEVVSLLAFLSLAIPLPHSPTSTGDSKTTRTHTLKFCTIRVVML